MNDTENGKGDPASVSLDTGASFAKLLFLGTIVEENIFPFPTIDAVEQETVQMVIDSIDKFLSGREEEFASFDREGEQPTSFLNELRELGLFGLIVPEEYEGIGFSNRAYSRVVQQVSRYDGSTAITMGAHSSIGMRGLVLFGNEDQKKRYLPRLASGEMVAAYCLTEAGSGSDAASIKTTATKNEDGSWTLTGEKIWITNGPIADFFTVAARTDTDKGKLSLFMVERGWDGVSTGPKEDKMGIRSSSTCTVSFEGVRVPAENMLGEEGKGFKLAMSILNNGRTGLGGGCVGAMKTLLHMATVQARERKQFGKSISEFELIQQKLGQMAVDCFAAESVVTMVAYYIDSGVEDFSVEAAISKVFATEALWRSSNEALQVAGGNGFMKEFPYERIVRDSRINLIFEGTNEILRLLIALSGMKDVGSYLKEIGKSGANIFNDPIKGFGVLSDYAQKKLTQLTSIGRDRIEGVHPSLAEQASIFEACTLDFSRAVEALLRKHKKNIIGKQFASKRVANIVIDLFVGLCVLSRVNTIVTQSSVEKSQQELSIAKLFTAQAKTRIQENLRGLERNEDEHLKQLSQFVVEQEGFIWDIL